MSLRDPRNYSTDHLMLKAKLLRQPTKSHKNYLCGQKKFPLTLPMGPPPHADSLYADVKAAIHISKAGPPPPSAHQWMSDATLQLIDTRAALRRTKSHDRTRARQLTRQINYSLKQDRKRRTEKATEEIGTLLEGDTPDLLGAFAILKRWYQHATAHQPKPSREDLLHVTNTFRTLYTAQPPTGPPIPIQVAPFPIEDGLPTEDEIGHAIRRLKNNKAPGPSKI
jgi:hypothetical protein